jgi:hypothetical protein
MSSSPVAFFYAVTNRLAWHAYHFPDWMQKGGYRQRGLDTGGKNDLHHD